MADNLKIKTYSKPDWRSAWFHDRQETLARFFVLMLLLVVIGLSVSNWTPNDTLEVYSSMASAGGWDPDVIHAEVGKPLYLRLTSDDVVHGFGIGQTDISPVEILPGEWTELTLLFDKPGTYTFYCTRWCGKDHWRMRGTLEVGEPEQASPPAELPLYLRLGLDIDAPHISPVIPAQKPSAATGSQVLATGSGFNKYLSEDYYRSHSPFEVYDSLSEKEYSDNERWSIVAGIWRANTSSEKLEEGRKLFTENCAACHGTSGSGDGVFADDLETQASPEMDDQHGIRKPVSLNDPKTIFGASPALLHGKISRGGMGSGMPMWGVIFTQDQIWNLVAYIYSFVFIY